MKRAAPTAAVIAIGLAMAGGCQRAQTPSPPNPSPNPPSPPPSPPSDGITVNGTERLGWTHELPPGIAIGGVEFNAYVDNARKPLTDVSCTAQSQTLYDCAAPLPDMPDGRHELRMTSVHRVSGKMVESTKSAPLAVVKVPASTAVPSSERRELAAMVTVPPPAQTGFTSRIVAAGTGAIADLAVAGDGRVFAAERGGRVLVLDSARGPGAATALHLEDLETTGNRGLFPAR